MSDAAPSPAEQPTTAWGRALHERQIVMLGLMAEAGLDMALDIHRQATAGGEPAPERACIDFARVSRAVRLTLMLQAKLIKDLEDRDARAAKEADRLAWNQACDRKAEAFEQKRRVTRIVERIAEGELNGPERLAREACERLDQDDIYGDILDRPVSELIAMICHDLGLDPDWPRLAEEAWARAEIERGAVGWPLAGLKPADDPANLVQGHFRPSG